MTNEQQQIREWMQQFDQATPEKPTIPDLATRKLRAKLILEEALETIEALGLEVIFVDQYDGQSFDTHGTVMRFESYGKENLALIADGCADLKVVTEGTLVACGLVSKKHFKADSGGCQINEYDPFFNEVMRSNFSKLWTSQEVGRYTGEGEAFDPTGIIATDTYEAEDGTRIYCIAKGTKRPFLVKDKDGKVIKSPSYSPANLQPIIDEMSK